MRTHFPLTRLLSAELDDNTLTKERMRSITKDVIDGAIVAYQITGKVPSTAALKDDEFLWLLDTAKIDTPYRKILAAQLMRGIDTLPKGYVTDSYRIIVSAMNSTPCLVAETDFIPDRH